MPIVRSGPELYHYLNAVESFIAPPVTALFLCAILLPRATERAAFYSLVLGFAVGAVRFVTEFVFASGGCGFEDTRHWLLKLWNMNYLHFAILLFAVSLGCLVLVSFFTKPIPKKCVCCYALFYASSWLCFK